MFMTLIYISTNHPMWKTAIGHSSDRSQNCHKGPTSNKYSSVLSIAIEIPNDFRTMLGVTKSQPV